jgi:hypothetical protein
MSAIYLSPKSKSKRSANKKAKKIEQQERDELLAVFPLPRYFQIHFQHIHERNEKIHQELSDLKHKANQVESRLDDLLTLLAQQKWEDN